MLLRIWAATVVLTASCLISGVITLNPSNATSAFKKNAIASSKPSNTKPIIVTKAEFGIQNVDAQGKVVFIPTDKVPFEEGSKYGWRIQLQNYKGEVTWREVLQLPNRPDTWGIDSGQELSISANGQEAVTKRTVKTTHGLIQNFWTITPGDPVGKHKIAVYIDDRMIASMEFEIVPVKRN
ncbi:MAG: hypothetical protein ACFKPT_26590 [Gloeotrichia echinulata GP01]